MTHQKSILYVGLKVNEMSILHTQLEWDSNDTIVLRVHLALWVSKQFAYHIITLYIPPLSSADKSTAKLLKNVLIQ